MFSVDHTQDLWPPEDAQGGSLVSSVSGQSRSELENYTSEALPGGRNQPSRSGSAANWTQQPFKTPGILRSGEKSLSRNGQPSLPAEKAFSIQIGWRLFKLSGASIMSDGEDVQSPKLSRTSMTDIPRAPSYFSTYFEEQVRQEENAGGLLKTLFIDRDPDTFADICYWILPRDTVHYVRLYADAQFYSLPRLISQLFDAEICVSIGGTQFQIPRDTFSGPGNSSNFFSLGFAGFLGSRDDAFPGLEARGLMRPPAVPPQSVPNRSPHIFADLTNIARGYPVTVKDANHRAALLSDCKYYGLKGLMHKIFVHDISYNAERNVSEIIMRLEDLHKSGISFLGDASPSDASPSGGWVNYARPFVDETSYEAIVEIGSSETKIDWRSMRAVFYGVTKARISSLFQVVADKMNLPSNLPLGLMMSSGGASAAPASPANTPLSEDRVKIRIGPEAAIILDGQEHFLTSDSDSPHPSNLNPPSAEEVLFGDDTSSNPSNPSSSSTTAHSSTTRIAHPQQLQQAPSSTAQPPSKKRKREGPQGSLDEFGEWIIRKGQWRMRVQPKMDSPSLQQLGRGGGRGPGGRLEEGGMEIVLVAVRLDAVSGQRGRNSMRGFVADM